MAKNVACKYRVTATIKADTEYEIEIIKAKLIRAGQISFAPTPSSSSAKNPRPTKTCSLTSGFAPIFDPRLGPFLFSTTAGKSQLDSLKGNQSPLSTRGTTIAA